MNALICTEAVTPEARTAPFLRMAAEGLLPWAMSAFAAPTLEDWLAITARGTLRCCADATTGDLLGCGHFTPLQGRVWRFDFTAFRAGFRCAARQARHGFAHMFRCHGASAIVGITPAPFRHAWRIAGACGFTIAARLPGACWLARKQKYVDGVMVVCTPQSLRLAQQKGE